MTVSALSTFFSGSKKTRLLKHGMAGHVVEIVDVSWMAKPCGRSSRCMMFSEPPDFGVWLAAGTLRTSARTADSMVTKVKLRREVIVLPPRNFRGRWQSVREKGRPHN